MATASDKYQLAAADTAVTTSATPFSFDFNELARAQQPDDALKDYPVLELSGIQVKVDPSSSRVMIPKEMQLWLPITLR
ncbi:hypothetical protein PI124_g4256 [Phytophthora idaei]|nr:hypothetical protein PI125_g3387 [Phytophthora idaei]KAG3134792.1 hypothetical protein PI126_g18548 [Phytophthora idaei]KAG3251076.1 hypothetical protein PI124_g4256 [Phytophthora idaei]